MRWLLVRSLAALPQTRHTMCVKTWLPHTRHLPKISTIWSAALGEAPAQKLKSPVESDRSGATCTHKAEAARGGRGVSGASHTSPHFLFLEPARRLLWLFDLQVQSVQEVFGWQLLRLLPGSSRVRGGRWRGGRGGRLYILCHHTGRVRLLARGVSLPVRRLQRESVEDVSLLRQHGDVEAVPQENAVVAEQLVGSLDLLHLETGVRSY